MMSYFEFDQKKHRSEHWREYSHWFEFHLKHLWLIRDYIWYSWEVMIKWYASIIIDYDQLTHTSTLTIKVTLVNLQNIFMYYFWSPIFRRAVITHWIWITLTLITTRKKLTLTWKSINESKLDNLKSHNLNPKKSI